MQVELEDLPLKRRASRAAAAIGDVAGRGTVEIEHEQRPALGKRCLPPALASAGDHAFKREMRDDPAIGAAPSFGIDLGQGRRILRSCRPDMHDVGLHAASVA